MSSNKDKKNEARLFAEFDAKSFSGRMHASLNAYLEEIKVKEDNAKIQDLPSESNLPIACTLEGSDNGIDDGSLTSEEKRAAEEHTSSIMAGFDQSLSDKARTQKASLVEYSQSFNPIAVAVVGLPGTGKSYLATELAISLSTLLAEWTKKNIIGIPLRIQLEPVVLAKRLVQMAPFINAGVTTEWSNTRTGFMPRSLSTLDSVSLLILRYMHVFADYNESLSGKESEYWPIFIVDGILQGLKIPASENMGLMESGLPLANLLTPFYTLPRLAPYLIFTLTYTAQAHKDKIFALAQGLIEPGGCQGCWTANVTSPMNRTETFTVLQSNAMETYLKGNSKRDLPTFAIAD